MSPVCVSGMSPVCVSGRRSMCMQVRSPFFDLLLMTLHKVLSYILHSFLFSPDGKFLLVMTFPACILSSSVDTHTRSTTFLASVALSSMFTHTRATTFLAYAAPSSVFANPRPTTGFALAALVSVFAQSPYPYHCHAKLKKILRVGSLQCLLLIYCVNAARKHFPP